MASAAAQLPVLAAGACPRCRSADGTTVRLRVRELFGLAALLYLGFAASAHAQPAVAVVAETVVEADFPLELEALGTARANESIELISKMSEIVTAIRFEEGQTVDEGQVLVELKNSEALANVAAARAALADSRNQFERATSLFDTQAVSKSELDRLDAVMEADAARVRAAEARLNDTVIRAPFTGHTGLRRISVGSLVTPGVVITTLDDTRIIKLDFSIPETFIGLVEPGLAVLATSVAWPERVFEGTVATLDSRVDPVTRAITVRSLVMNDDDLLKPGMLLQVQVVKRERRSVVIPEQALVPEQDRQFVFVVSDSKTQKREVTTGRRRPGEVEILAGLAAGEVVVTEGTQKVREDTPVELMREAT